MYTEGVLIGSHSVGPFVWVNKCVSLQFAHGGACVDEIPTLLHFLMNEIDLEPPPCLRVLRHVYRRGPDWFWLHRLYR